MSLVDYQTYKDVTGDRFTPEAEVLAALARAQRTAEGRLGRKLELAEQTESLTLKEEGKVFPTRYPVQSVSVPAGATVADEGSSIKVTVETWLQDGGEFGLSLSEPPQYLMTYVGGYTPDTLPTELGDAICELAQRYCNPANTAAVPAGTTSVGVKGQAYSGGVIGGASAVPPSIKTTLRQYVHISKRMP